jgi:Ser/Thr protein kinase RdoA (MazF antagonist)
MENRVYEVEIEVDEAAVKSPSERFRIIKFYRPGRWTRAQIQEEHQFLLDLKAADIPSIVPLAGVKGATLQQVPELDIFFAVFLKQGGRHPDELTGDQYDRVGKLLARIHNIGASRPAKHRIHLTPSSYGDQSLGFLLDVEIIPRELQQAYEEVVHRICDWAEPRFEATSLQRIHGDCHLGNLIWADEGPAWVDFDDMVVGPCVQDLWLMTAGRDEEAREQREQLITGYESMREFDWDSLALIEPLRALRYVHFSAWIAKRWKDPSFPAKFTEFGTHRYWQEQLFDLQEIQKLLTP